MHEYGASLAALDEAWTPGRTLLYVRRITERYEAQGGRRKKKKAEHMTEAELLKSDFMKG